MLAKLAVLSTYNIHIQPITVLHTLMNTVFYVTYISVKWGGHFH